MQVLQIREIPKSQKEEGENPRGLPLLHQELQEFTSRCVRIFKGSQKNLVDRNKGFSQGFYPQGQTFSGANAEKNQ